MPTKRDVTLKWKDWKILVAAPLMSSRQSEMLCTREERGSMGRNRIPISHSSHSDAGWSCHLGTEHGRTPWIKPGNIEKVAEAVAFSDDPLHEVGLKFAIAVANGQGSK